VGKAKKKSDLKARVATGVVLVSVVAFLASEDARWITGDSLHVDGGSKL